MINHVKENLGIETNDSSQLSSNNNNQNPISWHNYIYPPLLKILHYSTDQLSQPFVELAKRMHACAILILVNTLINLLNVIIEIKTDCEAIPNIIILYSLLNVPIFSFCALLSFSQGYYAICQGPGHKIKFSFYQITQVILVIVWFVFSIIKAGPFYGWTKIGVLSECNLGISIFLAVVQNLIYLTAIALGIYCLIRARQGDLKGPEFTTFLIKLSTNTRPPESKEGVVRLPVLGVSCLGSTSKLQYVTLSDLCIQTVSLHTQVSWREIGFLGREQNEGGAQPQKMRR